MPWKDPEKQREAIRKHYRANRQSYIDKALERKRSIRAWVRAVKEESACADCRVKYPYYIMDFDHLEGANKTMTVSQMINKGNKDKIAAEIAKCEVVCSNCHRTRTFRRSEDVDI